MKLQNLIHVLMGIVCFALSPQSQAANTPNTPDPGPLSISNTADGDLALVGVTGIYNSAFGFYALLSNGAAKFNTGVGAGALFSNTADSNTAIGAGALFSNTDGIENTAIGTFALFNATDVSQNVAVGKSVLNQLTAGDLNTVVGSNAGGSLTTGNGNTFIGVTTGNFFTSGDNNTCIGRAGSDELHAHTGSGNVFIGLDAGNSFTSGDNNICIGNQVLGETAASDSTYIGNINITAQPIVAGVDGVTVDLTTGKLGHGVSSRRFKEQIKPMDAVSEAIYALKPVTFHYNKAIDPTQTLDFGLIAEEVAAVNPELAVRDREGKVSNYRHDAVNAMLLNEFLKEHQTVQELKREVAALTAGLQKVSAQLEVSKSAPQTVVNNH